MGLARLSPRAKMHLTLFLTITSIATLSINNFFLEKQKNHVNASTARMCKSFSNEALTIVSLKEAPLYPSSASPFANLKNQTADWRTIIMESLNVNVQAIMSGLTVSSAVILLRTCCKKFCPCIYGSDGKFHFPESTLHKLTLVAERLHNHIPAPLENAMAKTGHFLESHMPPVVQTIVEEVRSTLHGVSLTQILETAGTITHENVSINMPGSTNNLISTTSYATESALISVPVNNMVPTSAEDCSVVVHMSESCVQESEDDESELFLSVKSISVTTV